MGQPKGIKEKYYPESRFGGYSRVDGTIAFYQRIQALIRPEMILLDVGCGRGKVVDIIEQYPCEKCRIFKGSCRKVIGIDVDEAGRENTVIDEFRKIENDCWPVESGSIDLLVSDMALEHIREPTKFFSECSRVVKPGGFVCIRTPNRWSYVSIIASLIPNRLHANVVGVVQPGRKAEDVFPTYYRANTPKVIQKLLQANHLDGCVIRHITEPSYFGFSEWSFRFGVYFHRWLPGMFWPLLFVFAERTSDHLLS